MSKPPAKAPKPAPNRISHSEKSKGYRFIDKDPDLDFMIGKIMESGRSPEWIEAETARIGRKVSKHCITGWLYGSVKRPQNYTLESVGLAIGWYRPWQQAGMGTSLPPITQAASIKLTPSPRRKKAGA